MVSGIPWLAFPGLLHLPWMSLAAIHGDWSSVRTPWIGHITYIRPLQLTYSIHSLAGVQEQQCMYYCSAKVGWYKGCTVILPWIDQTRKPPRRGFKVRGVTGVGGGGAARTDGRQPAGTPLPATLDAQFPAFGVSSPEKIHTLPLFNCGHKTNCPFDV